MNIFWRVATLPPIVVMCGYIGAIVASSAILVHFVALGWPLCLYITARQLTQPPPQKRYPLFAKIAFACAIAGSVIGAILQPPINVEPERNFETYAFLCSAAAFGIGALASFWVTADALLKAETGKPWIANPETTRGTAQLITLLPLGIWWLHPRVRRLVEDNGLTG